MRWSLWQLVAHLIMVICMFVCVAYGGFWLYFGTCDTRDCKAAQTMVLNILWVLGWPERSEKVPRVEYLPTFQDACFGPTPQDASDYLGWEMMNKIIEFCGPAYFGPHVTAVTRNELLRRFAEPPDCDATTKRELSQKSLASATTSKPINCDCKRVLVSEAPLERIKFLFEKDGSNRFVNGQPIPLNLAIMATFLGGSFQNIRVETI